MTLSGKEAAWNGRGVHGFLFFLAKAMFAGVTQSSGLEIYHGYKIRTLHSQRNRRKSNPGYFHDWERSRSFPPTLGVLFVPSQQDDPKTTLANVVLLPFSAFDP